MKNIFEIAAANQQRAREVIRDSRLEEAWRSVGAEPNLVGSLRTGLLMKHRDIDFHIYSSPLNIADSFAAMTRIAENPRIRRIEYGNLLDAQDQCLEWHAWYADADDRLWQNDRRGEDHGHRILSGGAGRRRAHLRRIRGMARSESRRRHSGMDAVGPETDLPAQSCRPAHRKR